MEIPMRIVHLGGNQLGARILELLQVHPDEISSVDSLADLRRELDGPRVDWLVSAGFRHIIPVEVLDRVPHNCNVHISFLPWGRGAHPNVWAIVDGEPAGVSIHRMVREVDAGPVYVQTQVLVSLADLGNTLYARLEDAAVALFERHWAQIRSGSIDPVVQQGEGSIHRTSDFGSLCRPDLEQQISWRRALAVLRALTFPPHRNFVIEDQGVRYHFEIRAEVLDK
ncbi:MAG: formyltransferase family protein [Acidimicrobiales bacterium]